MKLLLVDDQPGVLQGLLTGIDWIQEGFEEVFTAQNAMESRIIFQQHSPDIMLCDIEMPEENGLQLFQWVCQEEYETFCIFLTSHAEFAYAQTALYLGALEYIVQPAPYEEIVRAVRKAIEQVKNRKERALYYDMGQAFRQQETSIAANVQKHFLLGIHNQEYLETLERLGYLPEEGCHCYLVLIQIVRIYSLTEVRNGIQISEEMSRYVNQIFVMNGLPMVVSLMDENVFGLILQNTSALNQSEDELKTQLLHFCDICEENLKCGIACYVEGPLYRNEIPMRWPRLVERKNENVVLQNGIIKITTRQDDCDEKSFHIAGVSHWGELLKEGYGGAVEEEAFYMLDKLVEEESMDAQTLLHVYQDFLRMLYGAMDDAKGLLFQLFSSQEELQLYQNGMKSVQQMKALIHHVVSQYEPDAMEVDSKTVVFQLTQYINDNLDSELKREELASYVHLNPDYMTRIFKKEMGVTVKEFIIQRKMREAKNLLRTTTLPVSFIAAKLAYCNFSHFTQIYKKVMGTTPQEERNSMN